MTLADQLTIGELAERSGMATSALRFYESRGLIASERTAGNQRRYPRAVLRRLGVIRAALALGLTLEEVRVAFDELPSGRTPTRRDWERLSRAWRRRVDTRIRELELLRERLSGCIGCGCLSLRTCALLNTDDRAAGLGAGAGYLRGEPSD
jgi:MerR family redox-sensitive transcriptional activator SoxR